MWFKNYMMHLTSLLPLSISITLDNRMVGIGVLTPHPLPTMRCLWHI